LWEVLLGEACQCGSNFESKSFNREVREGFAKVAKKTGAEVPTMPNAGTALNLRQHPNARSG
jgi:hypothetical protein